MTVPGTSRPAAAPAPAADPRRLGVHLTGDGADVTVHAAHANRVELCLLGEAGEDGTRPEERVSLLGPVDGIWHGHVPGIEAGQRYGFRVHGPWDPDAGLRHNPAKLLLDPYARAVDGEIRLDPAIYGHVADDRLAPVRAEPDGRDSSPYVAPGVVVEECAAEPGPGIGWEDTVLYEAHVRGLTMQLPGVPQHLRGTYAGVAHPATIAHLKQLGVTTIELLPIHAKFPEPFLTAKGLTNYWGYNTLAFFAPEPSYATRSSRAAGPEAVLDEVRGMVSLLHEAGLEIVLDVVYNHTCEGGADGPTLSLRGLDNAGYYLHDDDAPGRLVDVTGCGNSLDFRRTRVVQLALDSLRYWAGEVGVDGFRFDLAVTLGRDGARFSPRHPFLVALATDPLLRTKKLITEPWDLGPDGWRTGQFPAPTADWNDRFRNATRGFWLSDPREASRGHVTGHLRELATRLSGSADLFGHGEVPGGRGPLGSVNFVTAHDGFTLADLVTYDHKRNAANLEGNRDGTDDNRSWHHGVEGPVAPDSPAAEIVPVRERSMRNLLGTLLISAGVPMLTAGDEIGRSQGGNNNAYCQDNEISWIAWENTGWRGDLLATATSLLRLRREHPVLRPDRFATGARLDGDDVPDLSWYDETGAPMTPEAWHEPQRRVLVMHRSGAPWGDADALVVLNGSLDERRVQLPPGRGGDYELVWDSAWNHPDEREPTDESGNGHHVPPGGAVEMESLSMRVYLVPRLE